MGRIDGGRCSSEVEVHTHFKHESVVHVYLCVSISPHNT